MLTSPIKALFIKPQSSMCQSHPVTLLHPKKKFVSHIYTSHISRLSHPCHSHTLAPFFLFLSSFPRLVCTPHKHQTSVITASVSPRLSPFSLFPLACPHTSFMHVSFIKFQSTLRPLFPSHPVWISSIILSPSLLSLSCFPLSPSIHPSLNLLSFSPFSSVCLVSHSLLRLA